MRKEELDKNTRKIVFEVKHELCESIERKHHDGNYRVIVPLRWYLKPESSSQRYINSYYEIWKNPGDHHLPPSKGSIDFLKTLTPLKKIVNKIPLVLEMHQNIEKEEIWMPRDYLAETLKKISKLF